MDAIYKQLRQRELQSFKEFEDVDAVYRAHKVFFKPLAEDFCSYVTKVGKGFKPYGVMNEWLKTQVSSLVFPVGTAPRSMMELSQIIVVIVVCCPAFAPASLSFAEDNVVEVPGLVNDILVPKICGAQQASGKDHVVHQHPGGAHADANCYHCAAISGAEHVPGSHSPDSTVKSGDSIAMLRQLLLKLEQKKAIAVSQEKFGLAQVINEEIGEIQKHIVSLPSGSVANGQQSLAELESLKAQAVAKEDFVTAQSLKLQIEKLKVSSGNPANEQYGNAVHEHVGAPMGSASVAPVGQPDHANVGNTTPGLMMSSQLATQIAIGVANAVPPVPATAVASKGLADKEKEKDKAPPKYPAYLYDESKKRLVDLQHPCKADGQPDGWSPTPALQTWKVPSSLHQYEKFRIHAYQDILGYCYAAISAGIKCQYPANGVESSTPFSALDPFQRAMAALEGLIKFCQLTREEGLTPEEAREHMGLDQSPLSTEEKKDIMKNVMFRRKMKEKLGQDVAKPTRPAPSPPKSGLDGGRIQSDRAERAAKKALKSTCYACGQKGHLSYQCPYMATMQRFKAQARSPRKDMQEDTEIYHHTY